MMMMTIMMMMLIIVTKVDFKKMQKLCTMSNKFLSCVIKKHFLLSQPPLDAVASYWNKLNHQSMKSAFLDNFCLRNFSWILRRQQKNGSNR